MINFSIIPGDTVNKVFTVDESVNGFSAQFHFNDQIHTCECSGNSITLTMESTETEEFVKSGPYYIVATNGSSTFRIQGFITLDTLGVGTSLTDNSGAVVSPAIGPSLASGGFLSGLLVQAGQLGSGAIRSGNIASGQIGSFHIASGVLSNFSLTSGSVVSGSLGTAVVFSGNIASGTIPAAFSLTSGIVTSGHIASGQIGNSHLASGAVKVSALGSGIPVLQGSQTFNSGNVFRGLVVNGWDSSPAAPTNGRLKVSSSDWINTNGVIELTNGISKTEVGHLTDGSYTRTSISNVSAAPIEIAANDYSTSKVGIGQQGTNLSGKLSITPNSGQIAISVKNAAHNKDLLQLANSSGAIQTKVDYQGVITTNTLVAGFANINSINLTGIGPESVANNSIFVDSGDDTLKFKDVSGNLHTIDLTAI